ncbi:MAG: chorismate-binding protein [Candidatus Omnitrophota bacterium]
MDIFFQFEKKPLLFRNPKFIISCTKLSLLPGCFQALEEALAQGFYAAGFFSYEAGYGFEEKLQVARDYDFPLIFMGVYDAPCKDTFKRKFSLPNEVRDLRLNIAPQAYAENIRTIRDFIAKGDVYQITYCIKLLFTFRGDAFSFYKTLFREQPVPYPAYIEAEPFSILSLSPEMFIKKNSSHVTTKPMKGTWPRGSDALSDLIYRMRFQFDVKNRAENVMIADLLRNDLGRVGLHIRAPRLFEVAKYRTLYQMTSTVTGRVNEDLSLYELFASLFPSGSVTGAPKIRAMEIIRELEREDRHIYTGVIGYITPAKDLFFNIPIRTILIRGKMAEMGIGGGIVWDSTPQGEWNEGLLKAQFVTQGSRNAVTLYK